MNLDNAIDLAPEKIVQVNVGSHPDSCITVIISQEDGGVYVSVTDHFDGSERRIVLGQSGMTEKL